MKDKRVNSQRRNNNKLTKSQIRRYRLVFGSVLIALICLVGFLIHTQITYEETKEEIEAEIVTVRTFPVDESVTFSGKYQSTFEDLQDVQILAAEEMGIQPLSNNDDINRLVKEGKLVYIKPNWLYETEEVSFPYLVPEAKALLDEIAIRYKERSKDLKQLRLTGCLRTDEFIAKLRRRNVNSVTNSCHLYGTTFDLSYSKLEPKEKRILAQVLYELQQAGHCYVKYERKQPCFHITLRPDPNR